MSGMLKQSNEPKVISGPFTFDDNTKGMVTGTRKDLKSGTVIELSAINAEGVEQFTGKMFPNITDNPDAPKFKGAFGDWKMCMFYRLTKAELAKKKPNPKNGIFQLRVDTLADQPMDDGWF